MVGFDARLGKAAALFSKKENSNGLFRIGVIKAAQEDSDPKGKESENAFEY